MDQIITLTDKQLLDINKRMTESDILASERISQDFTRALQYLDSLINGGEGK